jgi:uncharacterized protein
MGTGTRDPELDRPFHVMTKPGGPACNLECSYCFYLDKAELFPEDGGFQMSEETLETYIRQYIEANPGPTVTFAWQGGEPTLLGVDFFRRAVELQEQHAPADKRIVNTLQTNGTLLDDDWGEFLATNDFLVGISIDGPRELHDAHRRTRADDGTFDAVMDGLEVLRRHEVEHNALCVVNDTNSRHPLDVYEFFREEGIDWIQFIPLVEPSPPGESARDEPVATGGDGDVGTSESDIAPEWARARGGAVREQDAVYDEVVAAAREAPVTNRSVDPAVFGEFLVTIFEEWVRNDVGEVSVRIVDQALEVALQGRASLCVFTETCGDQVAIEHDGTVYACDHFVEPGFERGNVHDTHIADFVDDPEQRQFGAYKREGLPERCRTCPVRDHCHGGCPKNWLLRTPDGEAGLNYLCAGYRRFFTHVQPYLDLFSGAAERGLPMSFVEEAVAVRDEQAAGS